MVILVEMLLFAHDNHPPASILLISGDEDFAPAVRELVRRGYTIGIAIPSVATASSALTSAGSYVWDWPSLARGQGIVVPGSSVRPNGLQALKGELIHLFRRNGDYIKFNCIAKEYQKLFGRQLRVADYGVKKLVDLFEKLGNPFIVMSKGMVLLDTQSAVESTIGEQLPEDQASTIPALVINDNCVEGTQDPKSDVILEAIRLESFVPELRGRPRGRCRLPKS